MRKLFWLVWLIALGVGLVGIVDRLTYGHAHTNYGSVIPWGLWVALYIYFVGLSAGAFLISSLVYVFHVKRFEAVGRLAVFTALITLLVALLFIWFDIGHMERAWKVLAQPNFGSLMAWMVWLYTGYMILLIFEAWFLFRSDFARSCEIPGWKGKLWCFLALGQCDLSECSIKRDRQLVQILGAIGVPLAIMFHGGVGALFGVVAARPYWHSGLYPIIFLVSALASGGALITLAFIFFHQGWRRHVEVIHALGKLVLGFLLLDVLFQVSELLVGLYGAIPAHIEPYLTVMKGPFWWVFWVVQIGIGTAIPILLLSLPATGKRPRATALASLCILLGFIGVRLNIVIPPLAAEEIKGLTEAYHSLRLATYYFPSQTEWLSSIAILCIGILLFAIGWKILPLEEGAGGGKEATPCCK
jgi:molybdopterin-containing oxidoreductase family membrane subunit